MTPRRRWGIPADASAVMVYGFTVKKSVKGFSGINFLQQRRQNKEIAEPYGIWRFLVLNG